MTEVTTFNYVKAAEAIFTADRKAHSALVAAEAQHKAIKLSTGKRLLASLAEIAGSMPGLTEKAWAEHLQAPTLAAYTASGVAIGSAKSRVSLIRVAVIAMSNGIMPEEKHGNLGEFVNGIPATKTTPKEPGARDALKAHGVLKATKAGASPKTPKAKEEAEITEIERNDACKALANIFCKYSSTRLDKGYVVKVLGELLIPENFGALEALWDDLQDNAAEASNEDDAAPAEVPFN